MAGLHAENASFQPEHAKGSTADMEGNTLSACKRRCRSDSMTFIELRIR